MAKDLKKINTESKTCLMNKLAQLEIKCSGTGVVRKLREMQSSLSQQAASDSVAVVQLDGRIKELLSKLAPQIMRCNSMACELLLSEVGGLILERGAY